jgi:hypothetical protein
MIASSQLIGLFYFIHFALPLCCAIGHPAAVKHVILRRGAERPDGSDGGGMVKTER